VSCRSVQSDGSTRTIRATVTEASSPPARPAVWEALKVKGRCSDGPPERARAGCGDVLH
jgi:hypothetical protein